MSRSTYTPPEAVKNIGVVGTGSVGAAWVAIYLARGLTVRASDPGADAETRLRTFVTAAWPALVKIGIAPTQTIPWDSLSFVASAEAASQGADLVQECVPEDLDMKRKVFAEIESGAPSHAVIASSTGGIPASAMQQDMTLPGRLVVGHPFNPPHLIPLVEIVGGEKTDPAALDWAVAFYRSIGKRPILLKREMVGHMANRLQFALLREAVHCLSEGIAGAQEIDDAVRYGLGLRWALMGGLMTFTLAGGPGGMPDTLGRFGAATEKWWDALGNPRLTPETRAAMIAGAEELADGKPLTDWIAWRDENLVALLQVLHRAEDSKT